VYVRQLQQLQIFLLPAQLVLLPLARTAASAQVYTLLRDGKTAARHDPVSTRTWGAAVLARDIA